MGCDIHFTVERRHEGQWVHQPTDLEISRNYRLFSILAGVRGTETPIAPPRGIPADAAPETLAAIGDPHDFDNCCMGPFSWLTFTEIIQHPWDYDDSWFPTKLLLSSVPMIPFDELRLVFWFDS